MNFLRHLTRWTTLALGCAAISAFAHDPGLSRAVVRINDSNIQVTVGLAFADAASLVPIQKVSGSNPSASTLAEAADQLRVMAAQIAELKLDGSPVMPGKSDCHFEGTDNASIELTFPLQPFRHLEFRSPGLTRLSPGHRQLLSIQNADGAPLAEHLLSAKENSASCEIPTAWKTPAQDTRAHSFADFLLLGVKHIWTGYDHLLFLFALLVVTRDFRSSIKLITCFTVAHSLTLAVATLSLFEISSGVVEPLIAASIVYVGMENLFRGDDPKGRWLLTFAFGLIHGFGFAGVLRELGVGANGSGIALPLISFNLGVELGQITIAALVLPLIWKLRTHPTFVRQWVPAGSVAVALLGTFWFAQRVWF
ncbi:MAG: HupE/UreJ family protein [Akkermansiaceae bacterium]|nr:HupE/UreJ family protein [Verrucomicrobiales bacterium]